MTLSLPKITLRYIRTSSNMKIASSLGNGETRWSLRITLSIKASWMKRRRSKKNKNKAKVAWYPTSDHGWEEHQNLKKLCCRVYHPIYNKVYRIILLASWQSKFRLRLKKTSSLMPLTSQWKQPRLSK